MDEGREPDQATVELWTYLSIHLLCGITVQLLCLRLLYVMPDAAINVTATSTVH